MPRISDLFNALVCFVFQTVPPPVEPPLTIRPETFPVVISPAPQPVEDPEHGYIPAPQYEFGVVYYKLGTWKTQAEAKAHAADFRQEMQVRDRTRFEHPYPRLSPWAVIVIVVPDLHDTYSIVLNGVAPWAGDALCMWLTHDGGPYALNEDGSPWVAWPAWTTRGASKTKRDTGRTCKRAGGW